MISKTNEAMYKVGLVAAIITLYSASVYTYFSAQASNGAYSTVMAVPPDDSHLSKILEKVSTEDNARVHEPSKASESTIVPGVTCTFSESDVKVPQRFTPIPNSCLFAEDNL